MLKEMMFVVFMFNGEPQTLPGFHPLVVEDCSVSQPEMQEYFDDRRKEAALKGTKLPEAVVGCLLVSNPLDVEEVKRAIKEYLAKGT